MEGKICCMGTEKEIVGGGGLRGYDMVKELLGGGEVLEKKRLRGKGEKRYCEGKI